MTEDQLRERMIKDAKACRVADVEPYSRMPRSEPKAKPKQSIDHYVRGFARKIGMSVNRVGEGRLSYVHSLERYRWFERAKTDNHHPTDIARAFGVHRSAVDHGVRRLKQLRAGALK